MLGSLHVLIVAGHDTTGNTLALSLVALAQRFEGAEILEDPLQFMPQIAFRGLYKLHVEMRPRRST